MSKMITLAEYPQLQALLWDQKGLLQISEKDAFAYYENRWRYLEEKLLTAHERTLIDRLITEQGNGHFLAAG